MATQRELILPRRGEVYLVRFDPTLRAEIKKTRPAVILQADALNRFSSFTIAAPLTSTPLNPRHPHPTRLTIKAPEGGLMTDSTLLLDQLRAIDKLRLVRRLGRVAPQSLNEIERILPIIFGLIQL